MGQETPTRLKEATQFVKDYLLKTHLMDQEPGEYGMRLPPSPFQPPPQINVTDPATAKTLHAAASNIGLSRALSPRISQSIAEEPFIGYLHRLTARDPLSTIEVEVDALTGYRGKLPDPHTRTSTRGLYDTETRQIYAGPGRDQEETLLHEAIHAADGDGEWWKNRGNERVSAPFTRYVRGGDTPSLAELYEMLRILPGGRRKEK